MVPSRSFATATALSATAMSATLGLVASASVNGPQQVEVAAGKIHEACHELARGQTLSYSFRSDRPLGFRGLRTRPGGTS